MFSAIADTGTRAKDTIYKRFPLTINDSIATGSVTFLQSGSYHIELIDRDSVASEHPIEYTVSITKDQPPEIVLVEPSSSRADLPDNLRLNMLARIRDDFGFRGVRLGYRISKSKYMKLDSSYTWPHGSAHELQHAGTRRTFYIWNLTPLEIGPEDEVSYVMEVTDNDAITGPKSARTPEYTVRVPVLSKKFSNARTSRG